jgi:hypothetical protein
MYRKELINRGRSMNGFYHAAKSYNNLGVQKVSREYKQGEEKLELLVNTKEILDGEPNAFLKDGHLVLESPISVELNQPFRSHLLGKDLCTDEMDIILIGFSEIELKPHYHYTVEYCQLINPNQVKIILKASKSFFNFNHLLHRSHKERHYAG